MVAKTQYNKASQARAKLESLARELQKDNKKLRVRLFFHLATTPGTYIDFHTQEDTRRLTISFEEARDEVC